MNENGSFPLGREQEREIEKDEGRKRRRQKETKRETKRERENPTFLRRLNHNIGEVVFYTFFRSRFRSLLSSKKSKRDGEEALLIQS